MSLSTKNHYEFNINLNKSLSAKNSVAAKNQAANNNIKFGSKPDVYKVIKKENLALPIIALASSVLGAVGYIIGSSGLYYDTYKKSNGKIKNIFFPETVDKKNEINHEGVKTIIPETEFAKFGLNAAKVGIAATTIAGMTTGLTAGMPMMTIGETINLGAAPCIETPLGTGLFGVGIASIFAGLALESNPELLLDKNKLRTEKTLAGKTKVVLGNVKSSIVEIGKSCSDLAKNTFKLFTPKNAEAVKFFKENIFFLTPKSVIIQESINKDGKVFIDKVLKQPKNYLMQVASAVLTVGGLGVVLFSLIDNKKAQKSSLKVEEGGFFTDNIGMTKFGIDKVSVARNLKDAAGGAGFLTGGIFNGISQLIGIDSKQGRAAQWLGCGLVFVGFVVDRGKHLAKTIENNKVRNEITKVARKWEIDLTKIFNIKNKEEKILFNKTLNALKKGIDLPESDFKKILESFNSFSGEKYITETTKVKKELGKTLSQNILSTFDVLEKDGKKAEITTPVEVENILNDIKAQTKAIFGENPAKIE